MPEIKHTGHQKQKADFNPREDLKGNKTAKDKRRETQMADKKKPA